MNAQQELWWAQTCSDYSVLLLLRRTGAAPCHQLHYLQMVTEKLGKAYFWRVGRPPRKSHASFVRFLQALDNRPDADRPRIGESLGFSGGHGLEHWIREIAPLAYELERLAPDLAGEGPNPEYPWPWGSPRFTPATFDFAVWTKLTDTGKGRQLLNVIDAAVRTFPVYG